MNLHYRSQKTTKLISHIYRIKIDERYAQKSRKKVRNAILLKLQQCIAGILFRTPLVMHCICQ